LETGGQKVSDKIVNLFEIKLGGKVLDIATCIGEQPVTAAKRVKPDVKVLFLLVFAVRCWG
jgi:ubiquinone/menaquinone biosynthesis C-methylase UbiE